MTRPKYASGTNVQFLSDRAKIGTVEGEPIVLEPEPWYHVRLNSGQQESAPESDLVEYHGPGDVRGYFANGDFGGVQDLIRIVTLHKLKQPVENALYSLGSSKTEFHPFQYKPLLKFLESEEQRLLIADEVGLGKTIEAGFILVELRARRQVNSVLVVCPAALVPKWQEELARRFDEDFRPLSSGDFRQLLRKYETTRELPDLRGIISLQSLRQRGNQELIEAEPIPLDLLIVDEAHHLRNPETLSHRTVDALAVRSSAVLFLTATPIHLKNDDLFHLLGILDPGEFSDLIAFQDRLEANAPVVEAERLVRRRPLQQEELEQRLDRMVNGKHSQYFAGSQLYERARRLLRSVEDDDRSAIVELERAIQDLNLLGHIITRSRKKDVFPKVAKREAFVVSPDPTLAEREFYNAVTRFVRRKHGAGWTLAGVFAAITAQRQVASSVQAAKVQFIEKANDDHSDSELSDLELEDWNPQTTTPQFEAARVELLEAARKLGDEDTKFDALLDQLRLLDRQEPGRKILIFSYFKGTLRYLERRLMEAGFSCTRIDGDVPSDPRDPQKDERGRRMRQFKKDPDLQVMLSSEVGSEGLDFQFCHVLINYDLPWNPMRVEQRIGRLDRLGQESDKILIVNLVLADTIEHRILLRLYNRIGIFKSSIGDLEAILGEQIHQLTMDLFSRELTSEEEEQRIEQAAAVLEKRKKELEALEKGSDAFVGKDVFFEEKLQRMRDGGEVILGGDLALFLSEFLSRRYEGDSSLIESRSEGVYLLRAGNALRNAIAGLPDTASGRIRLLNKIGYASEGVELTFDSELAAENPDLEFVPSNHALMDLAVRHYADRQEELHPVAAVQVAAEEEEYTGRYAYFVYEVTFTSARTRIRLEPFVLPLEEGSPLDRQWASRLFGTMLRNGRSSRSSPVSEVDRGELMARADRLFVEWLARDRQRAMERQKALVRTRLVSLDKTYARRVETKERLLREAIEEEKDERYIRLLEGTLRNMAAEHERKREELQQETTIHVSHSLISCGLLEVR